LITEREGRLWHLKNGIKQAITGLPTDIVVQGQGGLLDVALWEDPATDSSWVYLTYSRLHPENKSFSATGLVRGAWQETGDTVSLGPLETLFIATPYEKTHHHYGSRIAFGQDGMLYLTCGERGKRDIHPQTLTTRPGKVHRLHPDGTIPTDNPFANQSDAEASIWTWGHRNPQGMFVHPLTGEVWTHEHGPKGGDEINILKKGANYGWPTITFGRNYSGTIITRDTAKTGLEQPLYYWLPSIGACGLDMVHGGPWPDSWQGDLLAGSLSFEYLERLSLNADDKVIHRERLLEDIGRVRDIARNASGDIFVAIEGAGVVYQLVPLQP
jgi:glucose/arabinose dehydrogenase